MYEWTRGLFRMFGLAPDGVTDSPLRMDADGNTRVVLPQAPLTDQQLRALAISTRTTFEEALAAGRARYVGGARVLSIAGTASFRLENPAGSNQIITMAKALISTTAEASGSLYKNATLDSPQSRTPWNPNFVVNDVNAVVAQDSSSAPVGGTLLDVALSTPSGSLLLPLEFPVVLLPGTSIVYSSALGTGGTVRVNTACFATPIPA
jgi:hypothetical protein